MTTIGFIGSGNIGSQLARLAVGKDHDVVMSNSRGPETLTDLVASLGDRATAATAEQAAERGEIVVVTIPLGKIDGVPVEPLAGKIVIDTNNYYPDRDGTIDALENGTTTTAELLQARLPQSRVVKAFNHIFSDDLTTDGTPTGTQGRRALAIAGDDQEAKTVVADLIDSFGFDVVDLGPLSEGWRVERDTPAYTKKLDTLGLELAVADAVRPSAS